MNTIKEDDSLNVFRYEYLYNGAGIGVGDFDNDGWVDIFFSGNTAANKLFLNKRNFNFEEVAKQAGVLGNGNWATGVSVADVNADGRLDIYVCHSGKYADSLNLRNELFINQGLVNGIPVFTNMAVAYGLDAPGTQSTQAAFFDYDKDGDLDMFLLNHSNHTYNPLLNTKKVRGTPHRYFGNRLFRQDQASDGTPRFVDVTLSAGIINHALNFGLSVTISDVNQDGWPDIYTTSDYTEKDAFYINNGDGTFTESLEKSFQHIAKFAMGADIADYNNDGYPDIFTLDMLPEDNRRQKLLKGPDEYDQYHLLLDSGYYHQQMRNMLQLNQGVDFYGAPRFSEIGQLAGISNTDWSWAALVADFDGDGWKDLFVSNGYLRDYTDMDFLKYTVADAKTQALKRGDFNFQTLELVKQMPSNRLRNYLYRNVHDLTFSDKTVEWGLEEVGISNAAAYADLDNDGDLDLVVCNNNQPAFVYRNNAAELGRANFLTVRLEGSAGNRFAYGARVVATTVDGRSQYLEQYPVRGYQSSVSTDLHFGIPEHTKLASVTVTWPDGKQSEVKTPTTESLLLISQRNEVSVEDKKIASPSLLFEDITKESGLIFKHTENDFIDTKGEVLLPYQLSRQGPALAKADINGDGLDDIFVGGAIGQPGVLYLQTGEGKFRISGHLAAFIDDKESEDVNAMFFDVDNDGDKDLYVVSGGNEYADESPEYADRLYLNDGKGVFMKAVSALPAMLSSKETVAIADFDNDGDLDLFVGGYAVPGAFPMPARSYLLRNDSGKEKVLFTDITNQMAPQLLNPGMISIASWQDLDNDGFPELVTGGDWMPILVFKNDKGKLQDVTGKTGLGKLNGMWSGIHAADVNGDGLTDFILGNCGLNNQFKASPQQPMQLYVADFDNNGTLDPIICYYIQGVSYPMASRDELLDQMNGLKKRFVKYRDYADVTIDKLFPKALLKQARVFECSQLASGILYNKGGLKFVFEPFPVAAQFSRVYGIVVDDFTGDGKKDILLTGNFYPYRTQLGQSDASWGTLLVGSKDNTFSAVPSYKTGLFAGGDVRQTLMLQSAAGEKLIVVAKNNDFIQVLKMK